jgi:capsule polysaccharide export protein KpsE/RkpR
MTAKERSMNLSAGLCIAVAIIAGLLGTAVAEQGYYNIYLSNAPQTAQEREELFRAIMIQDGANNNQTTLYSVDPYKALQNPYALKDPQAELEQMNTLKSIQKLNGVYYSSSSENNWDYWANMWLNGPEEAFWPTYVINGYGVAQDVVYPYKALQNPYALKDPQAELEQMNTLKSIQKLNGVYYSSSSENNWDYWANMWLNGPQN